MIKEFINAESVKHAVEMNRQGYAFLAGGTQINNASFKKWNKPIEKVIALHSLKLQGIGKEQKNTIIGAMTALQDIADSQQVPAALGQAAALIPSRSVRNMATIGGNVRANRSDSSLIPTLLAIGARVRNAIGTEELLESYLHNNRDNLILEFVIPPLRGFCAVIKESRSHQALPVVSAAVRLATDGDRITEASVYAGVVADRVIKLPTVEQAIVTGEDIEQAVRESIHPQSDILGSTEFKLYLNAVCIADAAERCGREVFS